MPAEHARTQNVRVDQLEAGMKVHKPVLGRGGKVLVNAGEILSHKHVTQLNKWEAREKPKGAAQKKKDPKNRLERYQHDEFQGGWRPSHFNPRGILVSATLASGDETPAVEKDPFLSPVVQKNLKEKGGTSVSMTMDTVPESELVQKRDLREEIRTLEGVNAQLGGELHKDAVEVDTVEALTARRDGLNQNNQTLINEMKASKAHGNSAPAVKSGSRKPTRKK